MLYWDTETGLIQDGLLAPPLACIQWAEGTQAVPELVHHADPAARRVAERILTT